MKKILAALFTAALLASSASAGYISLTSTTNVRVEKGKLLFDLKSINRGDESAFNVRAELRLAGKSYLANKVQELPINHVYNAKLSLPLAYTTPGTYPLVLVLHYTDANQYPFSALIVPTFTLGEEIPSPLFGQATSVTFAKEGKINFQLKNLGSRPVEAQTYLVYPRELNVAEEKLSLSIPAKGVSNGSFSLTNFSALNGSTYQLFIISEFNDEGRHFTSVTPATVRIVEQKSLFGISYPILFGLLALLIIFFVFSQFYNRQQ